jgi:hypothetical protein
MVTFKAVLATSPPKAEFLVPAGVVREAWGTGTGVSFPLSCDERRETAFTSNAMACLLSPFWIRAAACKFKPEIQGSDDIILLLGMLQAIYNDICRAAVQ